MIQTNNIEEVFKTFKHVEVHRHKNVLLEYIKHSTNINGESPMSMTLKTRWRIFIGRLKSLITKKQVTRGSALIRFENGVLRKIDRHEKCVCHITYYLFKIPIYRKTKTLSDNEVVSLFKDEVKK